MKHLIYFFLGVLLLTTSCKKDPTPPNSAMVTLQIAYSADSQFDELTGIKIRATGSNQVFEAETNAQGKATLELPFGIFDFSASGHTHSVDGKAFVYNGLVTGVSINNSHDPSNVVEINMVESKLSQIIVKEVYTGGITKLAGEGSGTHAFDRYVILYNNSEYPAEIGNLCITGAYPFNAQGTNKYYEDGSTLIYENLGWTPAAMAYWYFQQNKTLQPGEQIVVSLGAAVNHKATFSNSVDLSKSEYYVTYDVENFNSATYYPAPSSNIPTTQYLKSVKFSQGTAWTSSVTSPGIVLFSTEGVTPQQFGADVSNVEAYYGSTSQIIKKVPTDWIVDGMESFLIGNDGNHKRLTTTVDAGFVYHINKEGYSLYRNVNKSATEALPENSGKLVYNYGKGTDKVVGLEHGSTDPSGIDAEASIKNGARIIYMDTNNSTNDFHLRNEVSLRD